MVFAPSSTSDHSNSNSISSSSEETSPTTANFGQIHGYEQQSINTVNSNLGYGYPTRGHHTDGRIPNGGVVFEEDKFGVNGNSTGNGNAEGVVDFWDDIGDLAVNVLV